MNLNDPLNTLKVRGLTSGSATIATTSITFNSDNSWDFTDVAGVAHHYNGEHAEFNALLQSIFVGSGGFPAGTKLFGFA